MTIDLNKFDIPAMRAKYAGGATAWSDAEVYADYTTYHGIAPLLAATDERFARVVA